MPRQRSNRSVELEPIGSSNGNANRDEIEEEPKIATFRALFRHASAADLLLVLAGVLAAIVGGLCMPAMFFLYGYISNSFVCYGILKSIYDSIRNGNSTLNSTSINDTLVPKSCEGLTQENFLSQMSVYAGSVAGVGGIQIICGYIMMMALTISAENQLLRVRHLFLKSFLRQDIEWFDKHRAGEFASRAVDDLQKYKDGVGDKIGMAVYYCSVFIGSIILSLVQGWKLTLVILSVTPLLILPGAISAKVQLSFAQIAMEAYAKAGTIAEEVLSSIRTVLAFGGEHKEIDRYAKHLTPARQAGIKSGILGGIAGGMHYFTLFLVYALAFWYGMKLIVESRYMEFPQYTPKNFTSIMLNLIFGAFFVGQISPHMEAIATARSAITFVYQIIDRIPAIDSESEAGLKNVSLEGNVTFEDVYFDYPSRPGFKVLQGLNLKIHRGETVAFVGESGCGKSTTIQLLQRFYDPMRGQVKIDDTDLRLFNIGWLREQIGVVGQEPVLFETTIFENIKYGKRNATMDDVISAAKQANAHNFIMKLPEQYKTMVGERGAQLSGGQKQRIAIARALVRDPKILLLDEATSALDTESEITVQHALEKASFGRTTLVIAHRLSTVRNADKIVGLTKGRVSEIGSHNELMQLKGIYYNLVMKNKDEKSQNEETQAKAGADEEVKMNPPKIEREISRQGSIRSIFSSFSAKSRRQQPDTNDPDLEEVRPSFSRLLKENSPEWMFLVLGCLGSILMGALGPLVSIPFGEMFGIMAIRDPQEVADKTYFYAMIFIAIAGVGLIGKSLEHAMFAVSGEKLTMRLRKLTFSAMLRQEIAWFDKPENRTGALCSRLASDTGNVQGAARSCADAIVQSIATLAATIIVNLVLEWRLGLVALAFIPLIITGFYLQKEAMFSSSMAEMKSLDTANKAAVEAVSNIKTVAALHREKDVLQAYYDAVYGSYKKNVRASHVKGLMFGFSQSVLSFSYAAVLYYGSCLVLNKALPYKNVLKINQLMLASSYTIGQVMSFAPNYNRGIISAARIFQLWDRKSKIDSFNTNGISLNSDSDISVDFQDVHFRYPSRPEVKILRGLNLFIPGGKSTAFVGSSGCGKSTCMQLLQRFYDADNGKVLVNGHDITALNIKSLRSCIGIVSQEPTLFDKTIAENIAYGDNARDVPMNEIIEVARKANLHQFVTTLPEGYNTNVGARGLQLSGGQKQRIGIARALLRNPKVLLLDEATSALDSETEKIIQKTLDEVQKGRTSIAIAHRLDTIKDAQNIVVFHEGKVVESGTHDQLLDLGGQYHKFYKA